MSRSNDQFSLGPSLLYIFGKSPLGSLGGFEYVYQNKQSTEKKT